jgi:hypothetical protein
MAEASKKNTGRQFGQQKIAGFLMRTAPPLRASVADAPAV